MMVERILLPFPANRPHVAPSALQNLYPRTQGVALGFHISRLWRWEPEFSQGLLQVVLTKTRDKLKFVVHQADCYHTTSFKSVTR